METFWEVSQWMLPVIALVGWFLVAVILTTIYWIYSRIKGVEFDLVITSGISYVLSIVVVLILVGVNPGVRQYQSLPGHHYALLLNGELARFGYRGVQLAPWPLPTKYEVVKYPNTTTFKSGLQPITTNPKVIPLKIAVIYNMDETPEVVKHYAINSERWEKAVIQVQKEAFEFFQHRLSQEQANALNPYDPEKMDQLHRMVTAELTPRLPFGLKIAGIQLSME